MQISNSKSNLEKGTQDNINKSMTSATSVVSNAQSIAQSTVSDSSFSPIREYHQVSLWLKLLFVSNAGLASRGKDAN